MDYPFGFPGSLDPSITPEQGISGEVVGHFHQIPPIFSNSMNNTMYDLSSKPHSVYFKTRMCIRFISGSCSKGGNCNFAHSIEELRRPLGNIDRRVLYPQDDRTSRNEQNSIVFGGELFDFREEQKLHKNKVCWKFYNGEICPYGNNCSFSHVEPGSLQDNSLFNQKSLCWKTKICHKWLTSGSCSYGEKCSYAHGDSELRKPGGDITDLVEKTVAAVPPPPPNYTANLTDNTLSNTMKESGECREALVSQPKIRGLALKKISRIYGDWIDDNA